MTTKITAAGLIEKLKQFAPDTPVVAHDKFGDCIYIQKAFADYDYRTDEAVVVLAREDD